MRPPAKDFRHFCLASAGAWLVSEGSTRGGVIAMVGPGTPYVELKETHSAVVLLVGDRVLKLKKPVALGFLDFSRREDRLVALRNELELNRRLSPDVYLGVSDLNDGDGRAWDHVLVMRRLPDDRRLAQLVRSGADVTTGLRDVATTMAGFHRRCARGPAIDLDGSRDALKRRWRQNLDTMRVHVGERIDVTAHEQIGTLVGDYLDGRDQLFAARVASGAIVDGHGDLLADDVFVLDDGPRILDCLEFDEHLRHVDRIDDVASLAADLERVGAAQEAEAFLTAYRRAADDRCPETLLHHFIAYRAFVRAMVGCEPGAAEPESVEDLIEITRRHLIQGRVNLMLVGGAPGTGKTTVAQACGAALGWTVLRSDVVRKELAGIREGQHAGAGIDEGIYTAEWNERAYAELLRRAQRHLCLGESVILDATWAAAEFRGLAADLARNTCSTVVALRCELPTVIAAERIRRRRDDASDADVDIAAHLRSRFDDWPDALVLDTRRPVEDLVGEVRDRVSE